MMDQSINYYEITNIILVIILLWIFNVRQISPLVLIMAYVPLHFSFSVFYFFGDNALQRLNILHEIGTGGIGMLSACLMLIATYALLLLRNWPYLFKEKLLLGSWGASGLLMGLGYGICQVSHMSNFVAMVAMTTLAMLGAFEIKYRYSSDQVCIMKRDILACLFPMLLFSAIVGVYEVVTYHAWSAFLDSQERLILRASSILFNPNVFGLWAMLASLIFSYAYQARVTSAHWAICGMVLAYVAIYFSGSRGAAYSLAAILGFIFLMLRGYSFKLRALPGVLFAGTLLVIWIGASVIDRISDCCEIAVKSVTLIGERFFASILHLYQHFSPAVSEPVAKAIPKELVVSIDGRFNGDIKDAGWLVAHDELGLLGIMGLGIFLLPPLIILIFSLVKNRTIDAIYLFAILILALLVGFLMRYQVFPIWVIIGFIFSLCWAYCITYDNVLRFGVNKQEQVI